MEKVTVDYLQIQLNKIEARRKTLILQSDLMQKTLSSLKQQRKSVHEEICVQLTGGYLHEITINDELKSKYFKWLKLDLINDFSQVFSNKNFDSIKLSPNGKCIEFKKDVTLILVQDQEVVDIVFPHWFIVQLEQMDL